MIHRFVKRCRPPFAALAGMACALQSAPSRAQEAPPAAPGQFDPSDVYFQGFLAEQDSRKLTEQGNFVEAWTKLDRARQLYESVRRHYPAWKPEMVAGRSILNRDTLAEILPKAEEQRKKNQGVIAELEGGIKNPGITIDPANGVVPLTPGILEVDPVASRRLAEAETEVKRLNQILEKARAPVDEASRTASRLRDVERQRDSVQSQLRAAENTVQSLRSQLAGSPVREEMQSLDRRIAGLEQEREAMAMALTQSRGAHTQALSKIATLEADLTVMRDQAAAMRQKEANLDRDSKNERKIANEVVAGQRRQLQDLEKQLSQKSAELDKAHLTIAGLTKELDESRGAFTQLRGEYDSLMLERDQMKSLLKLNESERIEQLVEQNMGLAKNLREANEKVERLNLDNNTTKDDFTDALRDLAMAKTQINKLHQERREQDRRLVDLENRLKNEQSELTAGRVSSDPAEVEVLRDIIKRQLRVQERRRQARDLLIEAVKDIGMKDERVANAIELFDGQEVPLSPEEQRLIADKQVDGEFVSPFARDRATVGRATSELNRDISVFERTAEKAFVAGRLLPTRELFQMIVEQHPGHTPALCKLGVVHLRLDDPAAAVDTFRRAVELDANNPYAHRMLGVSFMALGDIPQAKENFQTAVELAPDDWKSLTFLGALAQRLGEPDEAENHYKAAISANPLASEAYINLARLYARQKRMAEARAYYNQALEHGALPDPEFEESLTKR